MILRRENTETVSENAKEGYQLRLENGCVVVYEKADNTASWKTIPAEKSPSGRMGKNSVLLEQYEKKQMRYRIR